ncbi:hypothetical protein BN1723_012089 [Verticillium longisporum]|uniref:Phospholipid/glycerol acyltransferase domain-containing protein n=1 Tax=Verticillium longisporum TaxID=100787 RepID=A0A0G4LE58_VERLO|nr:hypothetical protein BN1723_012089 [Verticillium longisporum]
MSDQPGNAAAAPPTGRISKKRPKELYPMVPWKYDLFLWVMGVLVDLFFREVHPRGTWKVPRTGPVLFVAAPHANQFVDALVLYRTLRNEAGRRVSLLIAQKSVHGFIGWGSRQVGLCSQKTRDARCGQPGGVGIYFISHVGGHKYSANVIVYRKPDAFGLDSVQRATAGGDVRPKAVAAAANGAAETEEEEEGDVGVGQCIWLARIMPEDCENLVRYTILQGKVVKPETQLRGGFDRGRGVMSW